MEKIFGIMGLTYIALLAAGTVGYVINVVHFVQQLDTFNFKEVVRLVGIVVPFIGAILGYAI